jgi:hypothetical protein
MTNNFKTTLAYLDPSIIEDCAFTADGLVQSKDARALREFIVGTDTDHPDPTKDISEETHDLPTPNGGIEVEHDAIADEIRHQAELTRIAEAGAHERAQLPS